MLDHVFTDAIGALRDAMENALLERQAFEERFQVDVLLGDVTWETSYGLPGEGSPPRVRADITLDWPTWAQTAYRNWYIGEPFDEPPEILVEVTLRIQRLAEPARAASGPRRAARGRARRSAAETLERTGPTIEQVYGADLDRRRVRHRGVLRGHRPARGGDARRRLGPRRALRRHGRLGGLDARAPRRPQASSSSRPSRRGLTSVVRRPAVGRAASSGDELR